MSTFAGSQCTDETNPARGRENAHRVVWFAEFAACENSRYPSLMPTTARLLLAGDTPMADTLPWPGVIALARCHESAWLVVRQMYQPPVMRCRGLPAFM